MIGGKYRVERALGAGAMGAVFEVSHRVTGKRFAIKWLMPQLVATDGAVKRFIREAQVAGRFEHPHVVEVYDIGQESESLYIVMELLEGESLADRLKRTPRMTPAHACEVVIPCLEGVAAAHQAGVIHRDIKPGNIFLCRVPEGRPELPKVLDFGVSKLTTTSDQGDATMTRPGMVLGTPQYMAPEQMRGERVDARADVYAFGVILYELLSGRRPFNAQNFADLVLRVMTETPTPLDRLVPGVPAELSAIVWRAMAREPQARFASLGELIAALEPFRSPGQQVPLASVAPALPQPSPPSESLRAVERATIPPQPRSNRALLAAVGGALLFALVAAWMAKPEPPLAVSPNSVLRSAAAVPAPEVLPNVVAVPEEAPVPTVSPAAPDAAVPHEAPAKPKLTPATNRRPKRGRAQPRPDRMDEALRDDVLIDPFAK